MKVIDLLNKIAKGEEVPEKIKWHDVEFECINGDYINCNRCSLFRHDVAFYTLLNMLNDEVEIIEEDKEIEKLIKLNDVGNPSDLTALSQMQWENNSHIERKINELIDEINNLKGEIKNGN